MIRGVLLAALLACASAFAASTAMLSITGVELPARVAVRGLTLEAASCGVRDTLWIDHYVAALYVPRGSSIDAVHDPSQPKAVLIRIVETRYLPERIPEKWLRALQREVAPAGLARLGRAYRRLEAGDTMSIEYAAREGVVVRVNSTVTARLPGQRVIDSILAAWAENEDVVTKVRQLVAEHPC